MAKGVVSQGAGGGFRVEFSQKGYLHGIEPVHTEEEGRIICDLLALKEAVDAGLPLDSLRLHTADAAPCTRMTESAESIVRSLPFIDVVLQLGRIAQGTNDLEADYEGVSHLDALGIAAHKLLCVAAYLEFLCAVQLLLLLHPTVASQPDGFGWFAAHSAAAGGSVPILRLLLGVAPDTIRAQEYADGDTPFEKALTRQHSEAARYLLQVGPGDGAHSSLLWCWQHHRKPEFLLPLFVELAIHHPLSAAQWEQLPAPCPGLSGALPAALQRSHSQARLLVQHLPPTELAVLHTALLCLAQQQRTCGVALPPPLIERVLCMSFA